MEANELRIGNWVSLLGNDAKIKTITNLPLRKDMYWLGGDNFIETKIIHFKPIQLNEEWLLKFGFVKYFDEDDVDYDLLLETKYLTFQGCYKNNNIIGVQIIDVTDCIKYVHQLQNLYFALCGEELTIK